MSINLEKIINENNIDILQRELFKYNSSLENLDIYAHSTKCIKDLEDLIVFTGNSILHELFLEHDFLCDKQQQIYNCLSFYIGFQKGVNFKNNNIE